MPLQFNTGGSPLRFRRSGDDELEVESDDEFADIISQALECLQQQEYLDGGGGVGAGEEESALTSSPMIRPAEPRDPSYTGPLYADREGGTLPP